jgi:hypothetical protein
MARVMIDDNVCLNYGRSFVFCTESLYISVIIAFGIRSARRGGK